MNGWAGSLLNQSVYDARVAYDFIDSPEFIKAFYAVKCSKEICTKFVITAGTLR